MDSDYINFNSMPFSLLCLLTDKYSSDKIIIRPWISTVFGIMDNGSHGSLLEKISEE